MKEVGHYVLPDADTWSFKTNKINHNGSFFGYGNDLVRGFDVYRFDGSTIGDVTPLVPRSLLTNAELTAAGVPLNPSAPAPARSGRALAAGAPFGAAVLLAAGIQWVRRRRAA